MTICASIPNIMKNFAFSIHSCLVFCLVSHQLNHKCKLSTRISQKEPSTCFVFEEKEHTQHHLSHQNMNGTLV